MFFGWGWGGRGGTVLTLTRDTLTMKPPEPTRSPGEVRSVWSATLLLQACVHERCTHRTDRDLLTVDHLDPNLS